MKIIITISFISLLSFTFYKPPTQGPNIVLIFFDDLGYGDLSCYGALDISTPNMDRIAHEGIRFTNFLAAQAVCSASRAALLTGCYPNRIGIIGALMPNAQNGLSTRETTIADIVHAKGYATAIFGKWHLGSKKEYLPLQHGFDEYYGLPYSNDMWPVDFDGKPTKNMPKGIFPTLPLIEGNRVVDSVMTLEDQSLLTKKYTDHAVSFINRNKNKPFFLYVPHSMPHVPIAASKEFRGKSKQGLYGDVIQELDWSVGEIEKAIKENGLEDNTLFLITSDNGPWLNFGNHAGSAGGLREGKGTSFEGGQREPCIIKWKGTITAGTICNQLCSTIDLLPTITHLVDGRMPNLNIDGLDISNLWLHPTSISPRHTFYYYYRSNNLEAVRMENWKYVFDHLGRSYKNQLPGKDGFPGIAPENISIEAGLYDLRRDPGETYDVSLANPDIVSQLKKIADSVRMDLGDDIIGVKGNGRRLKN